MTIEAISVLLSRIIQFDSFGCVCIMSLGRHLSRLVSHPVDSSHEHFIFEAETKHPSLIPDITMLCQSKHACWSHLDLLQCFFYLDRRQQILFDRVARPSHEILTSLLYRIQERDG